MRLTKFGYRLSLGLLLLCVVVLIALRANEMRHQQKPATADALNQDGAGAQWFKDGLWGHGMPVMPDIPANPDVLNLSDSQLSTLTSEHLNRTHLKYLILKDNQLTTIPPEIGNLSNLKWLNLSHNQIKTLPSEMGLLTNLEVLVLSNNQLVALPQEIGKLTLLDELHLDHNPITDAALEHLKSLTNLERLTLTQTKVTRQGVAALRLALPNCQIESDFDQATP